MQTSAAPSPVASPPAPPPTAVGAPLRISLADAVFIGLRDNRQVKSAYISRVAEKFDLFVAKARFRPTAVLAATAEAARQGNQSGFTTTLTPTVSWLLPTGAQFQFAWSRIDARLGGVDIGSNTTSLSVTQPLLRGAGLAVNTAPVKIAELQERINRLALKSTVADTVSNIITAYRTLLQTQEQLVIARQSLDRSRAQLDTDQALVDAGRMAAADLLQTRADIAAQQVAALQAEHQHASAQLALLALLAMDLHTNIVAADPVAPQHVTIDEARALAIALDNRMDLLAQRRSLEAARQNLIVARNDRLWTLSVVGAVEHQTQRGGPAIVVDPVTGRLVPAASLPADSGTVGLELRIPLGDYTLQQEEVQATTAVRTSEVQLADLGEQVQAQVRDAVQGVELAWRQVEAAGQARALADETLEAERAKLDAGRASNFEVLSFQTSLRAAATQELAAQIAYLNALTVLDQQLGTTLDTWKISLND